MMTSHPTPAPTPIPNPVPAYEAPAIIHKTQLKHFSGSPLATEPHAPDNLLGVPQ